MPIPLKPSILALALVFVVAGCQVQHKPAAQIPQGELTVPTFNAQEYESIPAREGRVFWIDDEASDIRFYLWRGGPLAAKGHNHVMVVRHLEGAVFLPKDMLSDSARFNMVFGAEDIEVDPASVRKRLGGTFSTHISEQGNEGTRRHMLGKKVLNAARFPFIGLRGHRVYGELPKLALDTLVTIHGISHHCLIPVTAEMNQNRLRVRGAFAIRQTDFGITPFSALAGALFVLDPIMIEFDITGQTR